MAFEVTETHVTPTRGIAAVVLPKHVRRSLIAHARREHPDECCGLLVGRRCEIVAARAVRNVARARRTRFAVDPRAHIALRRELRAAWPNVQLVGCYHSHPAGDARLSPRDVADAHYPDWIHVVIGLGSGRAQVRAFKIVRGQPVAVPLRPAGPILRAVSSSFATSASGE